jgi:high-affinity iron transporter
MKLKFYIMEGFKMARWRCILPGSMNKSFRQRRGNIRDAAIVFGFGAYILFEKVLALSGAAKESIEAICTGLAVVMLFYTGFWLLSQTEHKKWQTYIKKKTTHALSTQRLWALASIAFIAVFREAAETVLFYSALLSHAGSPVMVASGFLVGVLILFTICFAMIKYNVRIPMKKFFLITSYLMITLSVVLSGKCVNELVEAGYFQPTPIPHLPSIDLLGIYPMWETVGAQLCLMVVGILMSMHSLKRTKKRT